MTNGLPPEEADVASYGFVKDLKPTSSNYQKLLGALRTGNPFDKSWTQVYRGTPAQAAQGWAGRIRKG